MNKILYSYLQKNCSEYGSKMGEYWRDRKHVRALTGEFTAVQKYHEMFGGEERVQISKTEYSSLQRERSNALFLQNQKGTMKMTNIGMEILFRTVRRNFRKRCGKIATDNVITHSGELHLLFRNVDNQRCRNLIFRNEYMSEVFARYIKHSIRRT